MPVGFAGKKEIAVIKNFDELIESAKGTWKPTIAVAMGNDENVISAMRMATDEGLAHAVMIGDRDLTFRIARNSGISLNGLELVDCTDKAEAAALAVSYARDGRAQAVMKGLIDTATMCRAVLNKDTGIKDSDVLSHLGLLEVPDFDRLLYSTDGALNMYPDVQKKRRIIENALVVANALGNMHPNVACICALESVNPKMQPTVDANELRKMYLRGEITGCTVSGPLALDNALFERSARIKKITDPKAGHADILLAPEIETGNVLYKSLVYLGKAKSAGVVVGAKDPVIMTSRFDSDETKLRSVALAMLIAIAKREKRTNSFRFRVGIDPAEYAGGLK